MIGLQKERPNVLQIACGKRSKNSKSLQPVHINGETVMIMGALTEVDENNYEVLAFLHYISTTTSYRNGDHPYLAEYLMEKGWTEDTFTPYFAVVSKHCLKHLQKILMIVSEKTNTND